MAYAAEEMLEARVLHSPSEAASKWRSKVLTPIVQRQLAGVYDAYRPTLEFGVRSQSVDVTKDVQMSIGEATEFYLGEDPTDPGLIPTYRRNLIYSRELRWYLGILMEKETKASIGDRLYYNKTVEHQDILVQESKDEMPSPSSSEGEDQYNDDRESDAGPPLFTDAEIVLLVSEGIESFFDEELEGMVSETYSTTPL